MREGQSAPQPLFPSIGQAVLLVIAMLVAQFCIGAIFALIGIVATGGIHGAAEGVRSAWVLAIANVIALGGGILFALRRTHESPAAFFPVRSFSVSLIPPVIMTTLSCSVAMHEVVKVFLLLLQKAAGVSLADLDLFSFADAPVGAFAALIIVAPLTEEYVFRGLILRGLLTRHRPLVAIIISAALFGVMHANVLQATIGFILGLVFGWWYLRTGSLGPCIAGHASFNFVAYITVQLPEITAPIGLPRSEEIVFLPAWTTFTAILFTVIGLGWFKVTAETLPEPEIPFPRQPVDDEALPMPLGVVDSSAGVTPPLLSERSADDLPPILGDQSPHVDPDPPKLDEPSVTPVPPELETPPSIPQT